MNSAFGPEWNMGGLEYKFMKTIHKEPRSEGAMFGAGW